MINLNIKNKCRKIKNRLNSTHWLLSHIADCPKCQKRLARLARVDIALSLLKVQPHSLNLLMNANTKAINVLKHSLRNAPKAEKLRNIRPEPSWLLRTGKPVSPILKTAACITVIILLKTGMFESMAKLQSEGKSFVEEYYAKHLGDDYADELFSS
jgi:hypothetical protein